MEQSAIPYVGDFWETFCGGSHHKHYYIHIHYVAQLPSRTRLQRSSGRQCMPTACIPDTSALPMDVKTMRAGSSRGRSAIIQGYM
jgi:hypothetical protein